ncbi:hypothetical protein [Streptomyces sp. AC512_CC834]|uniref:hypothetical protein n=1 Tax=Streptomyces sp. AC512_CC834 TaxID=2823691 RepID=UPI001C25B2A7|nr:hypothetical protein [Streptomyces sp. AC512_CC834]
MAPNPGASGTGTPGADGAAVARAVGNAARGTARTVWRVWTVLALVLLIPLALGLAVAGGVFLYRGDLPQGGILLGAAGFLAWYCTGLLRGRGQPDWTALGGDGE